MIRCAFVCALGLVMVDVGPAHAETASFALVIGNNAAPEGAENLDELRYADDDAVRYYQLFSQFADARLLSVLDTATQRRYPDAAKLTRPPTVAAVRSVVESFAVEMNAALGRGDEPVLYVAFSGHGARDSEGRAYLALLDGQLTQALLFDDIIGALPATYVHLIIDACHAGGVLGVRGDGMFNNEVDAQVVPISPADLLPEIKSALERYPTVGAIVATTAEQTTHEWSELEAGVFSHEVISGLLGGADINGDLQIEYSELDAFIAVANREIRDERALPRVITHAPRSNRNARIVDLEALSASTFLFGDAADLGHFYVELDNGQRYLDANLGAGVSAAVAVPAGRQVYVRSTAGDAALRATSPVDLATVELSEPEATARGSLESALRDGFFAAPYTTSYYRGYVDSSGTVGVQFGAPRELTAADAGPGARPRPTKLVWFAGIAGAGSIATGLLAWKAKREFDSTTVQVDAQAAARRYKRYGWASVACGITAVVAGVAAWWLWPDTGARVDVDVSSTDHGVTTYTAGINLSW